MDTYEQLAHKTLEAMELKFDSIESIDQLIQKIRYAILLPGSETEGEIMLLSKKIADLIEQEGAIDEIESLLENLHSEVTFNYFD